MRHAALLAALLFVCGRIATVAGFGGAFAGGGDCARYRCPTGIQDPPQREDLQPSACLPSALASCDYALCLRVPEAPLVPRLFAVTCAVCVCARAVIDGCGQLDNLVR